MFPSPSTVPPATIQDIDQLNFQGKDASIASKATLQAFQSSSRDSYGNIAPSQVPCASSPAYIRGLAQRMLDSQTNQQRIEVPAVDLSDRAFFDADEMVFLFNHFVSALAALKSREKSQIASFLTDRATAVEEQAFRGVGSTIIPSSDATSRPSTRTSGPSSELFRNPSRMAETMTMHTDRNDPRDTLENQIKLQTHAETLRNPNEPFAVPGQQQLRSGQPKTPMTSPTFESAEALKSFLTEHLQKGFKESNALYPMQQPLPSQNMDNTWNGMPQQYGEYPAFQLSEPILKSIMFPSDPQLAPQPSHRSTPSSVKANVNYNAGDGQCLGPDLGTLGNRNILDDHFTFQSAKEKSMGCLGERFARSRVK
jgi:hypothetical protein